jgi:uncharacterized protein
MNKYRIAEHKTIRANGRDCIFLVADKAIFELDTATKTVLDDLYPRGNMTRQECVAGLTYESAEQREGLFQELVKRRVIVTANNNLSATKRTHFQDITIPLKTLILHLTDACNLNCRYCYHSQWNVKSGGKKVMAIDVARRAVDFLFEHAGDLEEVVIVFFGGEPLLNFKVIPEVVDYAHQKAAEKGKKVNFAITTNGTLLSEDIIDFFDAKNIGITISIDGFENLHDRYRRFPDGSPSYGVLLPKIKRLLNQAVNKPAVARVTLVENPGKVPQILDHLLGLGFAEVGFAPVTTGHSDYQLNNHDMDLLLREFQSLSRNFLDAAGERKFYGFSNIIDMLVSLHQGEVMNYPCGAGLGLFSIDPEGRLYLCQRFTGENEFCMGDIFNGFNHKKLGAFRAQAEISNKTDCKQCWVRTLCTGGCYHEACVREGSHLKPNLHYCEWIKQWSLIGLHTYCRLATTDPHYLEMLCISRGHRPHVTVEETKGGTHEKEGAKSFE